jgi:hypothetical protein
MHRWLVRETISADLGGCDGASLKNQSAGFLATIEKLQLLYSDFLTLKSTVDSTTNPVFSSTEHN